jgi:hypothetical protein
VQSTDISERTATDDNGGAYYTLTTDSAPVTVMYVQSIDMWYQLAGKKYKVFTEVTIVNPSGDPVEGATISIETTLPNNNIVSDSSITGADGTTTFMYGPTRRQGTYISTVIDVVKSGWTYDPDQNVETGENLIVP